jgi:hypothetical protein
MEDGCVCRICVRGNLHSSHGILMENEHYFVSGMLIVHISKHSFFCTRWSEISFQVESFNFCKVCMLFVVLCVLCACLILLRGKWRHHAEYFEELFGTWIGIGNRVEYGNGISRHLDVPGGHTDFLSCLTWHAPFDGLGGFVALSAGYNGYRCLETQPSRPLDWVGGFLALFLYYVLNRVS